MIIYSLYIINMTKTLLKSLLYTVVRLEKNGWGMATPQVDKGPCWKHPLVHYPDDGLTSLILIYISLPRFSPLQRSPHSHKNLNGLMWII